MSARARPSAKTCQEVNFFVTTEPEAYATVSLALLLGERKNPNPYPDTNSTVSSAHK